MTLQDLGSIGEFVAAIATVLTLVYLAVQIRHNTRGLDQNKQMMRVSFEDEIRRDLIASCQAIAADEQLSAIWTRGLADEKLDPGEAARFGLLMTNVVAMLTAQFHAHRRGFYELDRVPWFAFVALSPGFRRWWRATAPVFSNMHPSVERQELVEYIDALADPSSHHAPAA